MPTIKSSNLAVNQQVSAGSPDSKLTIEVDSEAPLRAGSYQFQLVVTDDSGNNSEPATVRIVIADDQRPTAVIDAPTRVGVGKEFSLSGERSVDVGGKISQYVWTLIQAP